MKKGDSRVTAIDFIVRTGVVGTAVGLGDPSGGVGSQILLGVAGNIVHDILAHVPAVKGLFAKRYGETNDDLQRALACALARVSKAGAKDGALAVYLARLGERVKEVGPAIENIKAFFHELRGADEKEFARALTRGVSDGALFKLLEEPGASSLDVLMTTLRKHRLAGLPSDFQRWFCGWLRDEIQVAFWDEVKGNMRAWNAYQRFLLHDLRDHLVAGRADLQELTQRLQTFSDSALRETLFDNEIKKHRDRIQEAFNAFSQHLGEIHAGVGRLERRHEALDSSIARLVQIGAHTGQKVDSVHHTIGRVEGGLQTVADLATGTRQRIERIGQGMETLLSKPRSSTDAPLALVTPERLVRIHLPRMGDRFTGRSALLTQLAEDLAPGAGVTILRKAAALQADGGVGKTVLAIELGWQLFEAGRFDYVFLLDATTPETLDAGLAVLAGPQALCLALEPRSQSEQRDRTLGFLGRSGTARRTLLLLDGADVPDARAAVRKLLPLSSECAILITTRHGAWPELRLREVGLFSPEEARSFLHQRLNGALRAGGDYHNDFDRIAKELDYLPLALEIVASYLLKHRVSPAEWLIEWKENPARTVEHHDPDRVSYPAPLGRVWERSVRRLPRSARDLLNILAFVAPRPATFPIWHRPGLPKFRFTVPGWWWMASLMEPYRRQWHNGLFETCLQLWVMHRYKERLALLADSALISWNRERSEFSVHRLLQVVTRQTMSAGQASRARLGAIKLVELNTPDGEWDVANWDRWASLRAHIAGLEEQIGDTPAAVWLHPSIARLASWLEKVGEYRAAESAYRRAVKLCSERWGKRNTRTATGIRNLAAFLFNHGRTQEAESLWNDANRIAFSKQGDLQQELDHAHLLRARGEPSRAELLIREVLEKLQARPKENPRTVISAWTALGVVLADLGRYSEAVEAHRRALEVEEKETASDGPALAKNIGQLRNITGGASKCARGSTERKA